MPYPTEDREFSRADKAMEDYSIALPVTLAAVMKGRSFGRSASQPGQEVPSVRKVVDQRGSYLRGTRSTWVLGVQEIDGGVKKMDLSLSFLFLPFLSLIGPRR